MNYKDFIEKSVDTGKLVKDKIKQLDKLQKSFQKNSDKGDVKSLLKDSESLKEAASSLVSVVGVLDEIVSSFDYESYFNCGQFAEETVNTCRETGIDVSGAYPVFEMFPFKIRFDESNSDLYVDRKKLASFSPVFIAQTIKAAQEKLNKVPFDASKFANEIFNVYKTYLIKKSLKEGTAVGLKNLYKELVPMARFKKEYDEQAFAFDVARLYMKLDEVNSLNDFKIKLGTERKGSEIRILDANGKEQLLSSISIC